MERLREAVLGACMLSTAVGIVSLIRPSRLLDRQIRFLISLLFVICLTVPFVQMDVPDLPEFLSGDHSAEPSEALQNALDTQLTAEAARRAEAVLKEQLTQAGITCTSLHAGVHIAEDGSIYISEVSAECSDLASACRVLEELLGKEVTICVTEALS